MGGLRYGPGPEVHQEHGPPSRCPLSFSVLNRRPCIADRNLVHHHRPEFQRRPADGMDLEGFEVHDLDIALFHKISRDGTNLSRNFLLSSCIHFRNSVFRIEGGSFHPSFAALTIALTFSSRRSAGQAQPALSTSTPALMHSLEEA